MISSEILNSIKSVYPLQGKIVSINDDRVVLDIGYNNGADVGLKLRVLSEGKRNKVGELEIISVDENTADARILSRRGVVREGFTVEELI